MQAFSIEFYKIDIFLKDRDKENVGKQLKILPERKKSPIPLDKYGGNNYNNIKQFLERRRREKIGWLFSGRE
jgi:UDP-N-acetylglucosamine pyrophosphorylase